MNNCCGWLLNSLGGPCLNFSGLTYTWPTLPVSPSKTLIITLRKLYFNCACKEINTWLAPVNLGWRKDKEREDWKRKEGEEKKGRETYSGPGQSFEGITANNTENLQETDPLLRTETSIRKPSYEMGSAQSYESISQSGNTQSGTSESHDGEREEIKQSKTTFSGRHQRSGDWLSRYPEQLFKCKQLKSQLRQKIFWRSF